MLFALGAAGSVLDTLQSLTASKSSSSANTSQGAADPFDPGGSTQDSAGTTGLSAKTSAWSSISPQTMSALIDAQSQSAATSSAPTDPQGALKDLFSQIDANGDGSIAKAEFENALGAGGTNLAAADDVFGKLDGNGDGSVSLDEIKSALQGSHHGGHHHMHAGDSRGADNSTSPDDGSDPLTSDTTVPASVTLSGDPGAVLIPIDMSKLKTVSLDSLGMASSSYDLMKQAIARVEQTFANSASASLSVSA